MSGLNIRPVHRIKGRQALERSIRGLLIRVHRLANHRQTSARDLLWCSRVSDELRSMLDTSAPASDSLEALAECHEDA